MVQRKLVKIADNNMPLSDFWRDLYIDEDIPIEIEKLDDYERTEVIFVDDTKLS